MSNTIEDELTQTVRNPDKEETDSEGTESDFQDFDLEMELKSEIQEQEQEQEISNDVVKIMQELASLKRDELAADKNITELKEKLEHSTASKIDLEEKLKETAKKLEEQKKIDGERARKEKERLKERINVEQKIKEKEDSVIAELMSDLTKCPCYHPQFLMAVIYLLNTSRSDSSLEKLIRDEIKNANSVYVADLIRENIIREARELKYRQLLKPLNIRKGASYETYPIIYSEPVPQFYDTDIKDSFVVETSKK